MKTITSTLFSASRATNACVRSSPSHWAETARLWQRTGRPARIFTEFRYRTTTRSWNRSRRVVAKAEYIYGRENPRYTVTSLVPQQWPAPELYEQLYCARGDMENRIDFYQEILAHPVPNDLEAVKVLAAAPAVFNLYMWLSYRCFKATGTKSIPIFGEFGLVSQLGCVEYIRPRRFRAMLDQWLKDIRAIWPECPASLSTYGETIRINMRERSVCGNQQRRMRMDIA